MCLAATAVIHVKPTQVPSYNLTAISRGAAGWAPSSTEQAVSGTASMLQHHRSFHTVSCTASNCLKRSQGGVGCLGARSIGLGSCVVLCPCEPKYHLPMRCKALRGSLQMEETTGPQEYGRQAHLVPARRTDRGCGAQVDGYIPNGYEVHPAGNGEVSPETLSAPLQPSPAAAMEDNSETTVTAVTSAKVRPVSTLTLSCPSLLCQHAVGTVWATQGGECPHTVPSCKVSSSLCKQIDSEPSTV